MLFGHIRFILFYCLPAYEHVYLKNTLTGNHFLQMFLPMCVL